MKATTHQIKLETKIIKLIKLKEELTLAKEWVIWPEMKLIKGKKVRLKTNLELMAGKLRLMLVLNSLIVTLECRLTMLLNGSCLKII